MNFNESLKVSISDDLEIENLDKLLTELENQNESSNISSQETKNCHESIENSCKWAAEPSSSIHPKSGDLMDSSDEEEMKNYLDRKYNEYGSDINKRLKQRKLMELDFKVSKSVMNAIDADKTEDELNVQQRSILEKTQETTSFKKLPNEILSSVPVLTNPIFGIRIVKPLISSTALAERMKDRKVVPFSGIPFHIKCGDLSKDWVIAGVIVNKSPIRLSKKGSSYSVWRLTDLRGEIKMISLFLFNTASKDLWKTSAGMCIAVLNPTILEKRNEGGDIACFSIETSQKVMILGESKDLGVCKARKKSGDACTSTVNLNECEYCIFHMKQEFNKCSRRSELQSSASGGGLNNLRNKVLGKNEVFYCGQSYTAIPAKKNAKLVKKDADRLISLSDYAVSPFDREIDHSSKIKNDSTEIPYIQNERISKLAGSVEPSTKQRLQDLERLKVLREKPQFSESVVNINKSGEKLNYLKEETNFELNLRANTPKLSQKNFNIEVEIGSLKTLLARHKASELIKKYPIEKLNPNAIRGSKEGKKRAIDDLNKSVELNDNKKQKLEQEKNLLRKSRIQRIIDAKSSHKDLVNLREEEEKSKYFAKLEKKESLEEKMLNTYKMPCKAVICKQCNYTAFSASDLCKKEAHILKVVDAEKRFFECKDCGNRTVTVFKLPKVSCKNCHSSRWERAAMIREKKGCHSSEILSIRGDEEMFIGHLASNANLNLCVPVD